MLVADFIIRSHMIASGPSQLAPPLIDQESKAGLRSGLAENLRIPDINRPVGLRPLHRTEYLLREQ